MPSHRPTHPTRRSTALAAAALLAFPAAAAAQPTARPDLVGNRVRIHATALEGLPITGTVESVSGDRVVVRLKDGEPVVIPATGVTRLEVARPRPSLERNVAIGGTLGALGGAGLYLSWCYADRDACRRDRGADAPETQRPTTVGALAVVGGLVAGAGVAWLLTPQRWESLPLPVRVGAAPTPRGGVSVGAVVGY